MKSETSFMLFLFLVCVRSTSATLYLGKKMQHIYAEVMELYDDDQVGLSFLKRREWLCVASYFRNM